MSIRFAIFAGVSTEGQAHADKRSIPEQIAFCRAIIAANKGVETGGPYVMDGYSRSGYDSLDVAMQEIPPLGDAIRAAMANEYDILIMDSFDRLGDIAYIMNVRFKKLRKQLYSARQSGRVIPPEQYDPYDSESADMAIHNQGMIQVYRINKIRRAYNVGVPGRAPKGLHSLSISYGYKVVAKGEPAIQIPEQVQLIINFKDWFLQGCSLQEICDRANASGVKPRGGADTWQRSTIRRIVTNPYYAGIIIYGKYKTVGKKRVPQPPSQWIRGKGKHQALWDEQTYYAILAEVERRNTKRMRSQVYALSGVLECAVCKLRLDRHGKGRYMYYYCRGPKTHIEALHVDTALEMVAEEFVKALQRLQSQASTPQQNDEGYQREIIRLTNLRRKVQEGYEKEIYTEAEARTKIVAIETDLERVEFKRQHSAQQQQKKEALLAFARQDLSQIREWIMNDDPAQVNHFLTTLCKRIIVTPKHKLKIEWRDV